VGQAGGRELIYPQIPTTYQVAVAVRDKFVQPNSASTFVNSKTSDKTFNGEVREAAVAREGGKVFRTVWELSARRSRGTNEVLETF